MSQKLKTVLLSLSLSVAISWPASLTAAVIAAIGSGTILTQPPASVVPDQTEGTLVVAFDEIQGKEPVLPVFVDVVESALPVFITGAAPLSPGFIAPGTCISSHYIHFDPDSVTREQAVFLFDQEILGIIVNQIKLDVSRFQVGLDPAVTEYPLQATCGTAPTCGLELGFAVGTPGSDGFFAFNLPNRGVLGVDVEANTPADNIRVITESPLCG